MTPSVNILHACGCSTSGRRRVTFATVVHETMCATHRYGWPKLCTGRYDPGVEPEPYTLADAFAHTLYTWIRTRDPNGERYLDSNEEQNARQQGWSDEASRYAEVAADAVLAIAEAPPEPLGPVMRTHSHDRQIVQADTGYAYVAPEGVTLEVGDRILLPANWLVKERTWAKVAAIGTTYEGSLNGVVKYEKVKAVA